ncbi:MAG: alpha/beta fold hydrolase, partial [Casimicrobium sp.]
EQEVFFVERVCPQAGAIKLHVVARGERDASPLLFVHGFPEFWYAWNAQLEHFSRDYRCYAVDLRGFNLSSQPTDVAAYKANLLLDDLRAVIAHIGGRVHAVIAHDWGGALSWSLAAQSPELMDKFVAINAPHTVCFANALAHDDAQIAATQYMNWLRNAGSEGALAADNFKRLISFAGLRTKEQCERYIECWSRGLTGGVNYYRASPLHPDTSDAPGNAAKFAAALPKDMFRVKVPTQVIWGTGDIALLPVLLVDRDTYVADLRIDRIEGASHWLLRENSDEVNRCLTSFLNASK